MVGGDVKKKPAGKSLVIAKNGKGALIPKIDLRVYDALVEKFELIEKIETSPKRREHTPHAKS